MPHPNCPTFSVPVGIPVYGIAFTLSNQLLLGGGGGGGRTGVKNKLISYKVEPRRKDIEEEAVYEVPEGEDAPMCLDTHPTEHVVVAGINSSEEAIKQNKNESCRVFNILEAQLDLKKTLRTVDSQNIDDYQKVVRFSEDGSLFATGSSEGSVRVFKYDSLELYCDPIRAVENDEILDVDISLEKDKLVCVAGNALQLVNLRGRHTGKVMQTIPPAKLDKKKRQLQLRSFRYGRMYTKDYGFAVLNGVGKSSGSFLCKVDAYTLETQSIVKISNKPVTAFCLSREGGVVVAATADYSIIIFDATTLRTLYTLKDAHGFSITCLALSPDRKFLASGSADNTCRIVVLPTQFPGGAGAINPLYTVFFAVLLAFVVLWLTTIFNYGTNDNTILFNALRPSPAKGNSATTSVIASPTSAAAFPAYSSITKQVHLDETNSKSDNKDEL